jgi:acetyl-CoA carboxylase, biotin carboxylase subunit
VDTHIVAGSRIPPFYDSLMAKVIAHGSDRSQTLHRMRCALEQARVVGVATNLAFHSAVLADPEFHAGGVDTGFLSRLLGRRPMKPESLSRG